jgi:hypothetical protein
MGSRSPRLSAKPRKPLKLLLLPALAMAGHCRMKSDSNDNALLGAAR